MRNRTIPYFYTIQVRGGLQLAGESLPSRPRQSVLDPARDLGHGGQTEDLDGDEDDGFDEVIYPVDFRQTSHIVDDDLHNIVVKPLQPGVRLTAIFDSCHSGSVLDLPYIYSTKGVLKEPNLAKEAGTGLLSAVQSYAAGDMGGVASTVFKFAKTAFKGDSAYKKTMATKTSPADVIMWSGSKDDQTSCAAGFLHLHTFCVGTMLTFGS